jgi:hypothetical protein
LTPIVLKLILSVSDGGVPMLDGENRKVIAVQRFSAADIGKMAACQPVASEEDAVLALGIVDDTEDGSAPQPLVLRSGESMLLLAPDGSIRLEGRSFGVRTKGQIKFNGATIELN